MRSKDSRSLAQNEVEKTRGERLVSHLFFRGSNLNTNYFFLNLFGHFQDIPANPGISRQKEFGFPGFEGDAELFGPHPFTWKTPTQPENIRTQKFGLGSFFVPEF